MPSRLAGGDEGRRNFRTSSGFYFFDDGEIDVDWLGATSLVYVPLLLSSALASSVRSFLTPRVRSLRV